MLKPEMLYCAEAFQYDCIKCERNIKLYAQTEIESAKMINWIFPIKRADETCIDIKLIK